MDNRPKVVGTFEGADVLQVRFDPYGGFVMRVSQNGGIAEWHVPMDMGNRHTRWIREWICAGNFPSYVPDLPPKTFGVENSVWASIGKLTVGIAAIIAAAVAVSAYLYPPLCK